MIVRNSGPKASLRKELRAARRAVHGRDRTLRVASASKIIAGLAQFACAKRVAVSLSFDGEIDTDRLIDAARSRGVALYVPVVVDRRQRVIRFYPLSMRTRRGTFGILVPERRVRPVPARWFHLIVVPLVGVDPQGFRLGMGGGFYDRAMSYRRCRRHWLGPRLVGFAFDCQRAQSVHAQDWDLQLDALATESGLQRFGRVRA